MLTREKFSLARKTGPFFLFGRAASRGTLKTAGRLGERRELVIFGISFWTLATNNGTLESESFMGIVPLWWGLGYAHPQSHQKRNKLQVCFLGMKVPRFLGISYTIKVPKLSPTPVPCILVAKFLRPTMI